MPGDIRLFPAYAGSSTDLRCDAGGARGVLGEAVRGPRLRYLAGQFPRHPDGSDGECGDLGLRGTQNPTAGEGPGRGGEADPKEPWIWHAASAAGDAVLRGLQPAEC